MMFKQLLIISIIFSSCTNNEVKTQVEVPKQVDEVKISAPKKVQSKSKWYQEMKSSYLKRYDDEIIIDTTIQSGNDTIVFSLIHYCKFDSSLSIPLKYHKDSTEFITHSFVSRIEIEKNNTMLFDTIVSKDLFIGVINKELIAYGVLRNPYFRLFDLKKKTISLGYSISIPLTDIGVGTNLKFILEDQTIYAESR